MSDFGNAVAPLDLALQLLLQLGDLLHEVIIVAGLDVVFHEAEGGFRQFFCAVAGHEGTVLALDPLHGDVDDAAVLLGQLDDLQRFGDLQFQTVALVDQFQQGALLGLGGDDDAVFLKEVFQVVGRDVLTGDGALADAGKHGVGKRETDENFIAGLRICHTVTSLKWYHGVVPSTVISYHAFA